MCFERGAEIEENQLFMGLINLGKYSEELRCNLLSESFVCFELLLRLAALKNHGD
jgi:hypothetical protein